MLWRLDAAGDTLWTRTYALTGGVYIYSSCRTRDGGFALVGLLSNQTTGHQQLLLLRTDSLGTLLWQRTYRWQAVNLGLSVGELPNGDLLLGGVTCDLGYYNQFTYLLRTDSLGTARWQRRLGTSGLDVNGAAIVCPLRDGGWAVVSSVGYPPPGTEQQLRLVVHRYSATDSLLWRREIGPKTHTGEAVSLLELPDGSLVGAGTSADSARARPRGNGFPQGFVFKLCADGDSVWFRNHDLVPGWQSHNYLYGLSATPDGGFVGAGFVWAIAPDTGSDDA